MKNYIAQDSQPIPFQPQYGGAQAAIVERPQMGLMEAAKTCVLEKYCDFSGRLSPKYQ